MVVSTRDPQEGETSRNVLKNKMSLHLSSRMVDMGPKCRDCAKAHFEGFGDTKPKF